MTRSIAAMVNPALLVWARASVNLSTADAAKLLAVDVARLAAWEAGPDSPSIPQLREISRIYRRPLAVFFLSVPPHEFSVPHDFRTVFEEEPSPASLELMVELRRAAFRRELAVSLLEEEDTESDLLRIRPKLSDEPADVAAKIREQLAVSSAAQAEWKDHYEALRAWRHSIEGHGVLVFQFGDVRVKEARGFSIAERPFPAVCANAKDAPVARIFSLAHELGHVLLGASGICLPHDVEHPRSADARTEQWCNAFAGALLVPKDALAQVMRNWSLSGPSWDDDGLRRLAMHFHVSREAVLRRLVTLGHASRAFYESKRAQFARIAAAKGGRISPPKKALRNCGETFSRAVMDALAREDITVADASDYLEVKVRHFGEIEHLLRTYGSEASASA